MGIVANLDNGWHSSNSFNNTFCFLEDIIRGGEEDVCKSD